MIATLPLESSSLDPTLRRTLSNLSLGVAKSKKIVVVTGAGISCSCGIPDFRSSDGLYNLVKQQYPDVVLKGRDLFDASLFRDPTTTSVFYTFISKLKQSTDIVSPSPTHHFIKTLDTKGKLLRSYTQNIDGLEERAGLVGSSSDEARSNAKGKARLNLKDVKNVQLHGDIRRVRCTLCSTELIFTEEHMHAFLEGTAPDCPDCVSRSEARVARSARALKIGKLRPGIVLYDEPHPLGDDIGCIQSGDLSRKPDLLIIMGTSLKVHGLKKLVKEFAKVVHAAAPSNPPCVAVSPKPTATKNAWKGKVIFVNKTAPASEWDGIIDYHVEGETDNWVERVLEDWKRMRPTDWEVQTTLDNGPGKELFKASKENAHTKTSKASKGSDLSHTPQYNQADDRFLQGARLEGRIYRLSHLLHFRNWTSRLLSCRRAIRHRHLLSGLVEHRITRNKSAVHQRKRIATLRVKGIQSRLTKGAYSSKADVRIKTSVYQLSRFLHKRSGNLGANIENPSLTLSSRDVSSLFGLLRL
ncbi:DHS-like NAD/FAD-binding domain-containing protein [Fomitiporia mediterranea MF3/22]|uniref:DHS-like NAD/FAD-binding domain-containing protein n=1 Tax=Fomitiporia mediterranea (strain MF3/22) TaxID=694068 RepID=UPI0004408A33|nr:DHS-like NAD/FAD-binding domain-containing protein [Fomitiporia mediterranea MF3/22]EJD03660.1 DHS-like NAD/FAD-binding domain-containing protein [Fomitiporia mediterranea MF3/22]